MEYCPRCNHYMRWYMEYCCGMPHTGWHCDNCGYDNLNNTRTFATTSTSIREFMVKGTSNEDRR